MSSLFSSSATSSSLSSSSSSRNVSFHSPVSPRLNSSLSPSVGNTLSSLSIPSLRSPPHPTISPSPRTIPISPFSSPSSPVSSPLVYASGQAINCFSYSPYLSRIVIGGKDIRLLSVSSTSINPLRAAPPLTNTAGSSISDLCFHPSSDLLLAAPTSGRFLVYKNIDRDGFKGFYREYEEHERTVNRCCWMTGSETIGVSASLDGSVKLWDINTNDKSSKLTLQSSSSVRDIAIHPLYSHLIAAAYDNGSIQLWDVRKSSAAVLSQTIAHAGLILTLDWHPTERYILASGGVDRFIRVWSTQGNTSSDTAQGNAYAFSPLHSIQTIASVGRVKWRPHHRHQLASVSSQLDFTLHLWNVPSPYIPLASCTGHRDVITGIAWADENHCWTVSKDMTLKYHSLDGALEPRSDMSTVAIAWNVRGDIAVIRDSTEKSSHVVGNVNNNTSLFPNSFKYYNQTDHPLGNITLFNHFQVLYNQYNNVYVPSNQQVQSHPNPKSGDFSTTNTTNTTSSSSSLSSFVSDTSALIECALSYRLTGSLRKLCKHNRSVCEKVDRPYLVQMWQMIEILYGEEDDERNEKRKKEKMKREEKRYQEKLEAERERDIAMGLHYKKQYQPIIFNNTSNHDSTKKLFLDYHIQSSSLSNLITEHQKEEDTSLPNLSKSFHYDPTQQLDKNSSSLLPISTILISSLPIIPISSLSPTPVSSTLEYKNRLMLDFLEDSCNQGDIQTCVVVSLVLQRFLSLDHSKVRPWLFAYLVLLQRLELFSVATELLSLSDDTELMSINNTSTTISITCPWCRTDKTQVGHFCECKKVMSHCSICALPVRGLYVWCQGCGHGGHTDHMEEWFKVHSYCPMGCLHKCRV